jgi:hypothetical protein
MADWQTYERDYESGQCRHQARHRGADLAAGGQLEEMTTNACARITEARDRGWLGEVSALEDQLKHLRIRTVEVEAHARSAGICRHECTSPRLGG